MNKTNIYKIFGRLKSRKKQSKLTEYNLKKLQVNIDIDLNPKNYNILDIGSGSGENAINLSSLKPNAKIITCELFQDGNINLSDAIIKKKISNIKLFIGNVLEFLDTIENKKIFDEIWILFPDPWPKKRHHKRRLINNDFIKKIFSFQKNNGTLFISSDSPNYIESIFYTLYKNKDLYFWKNQKFHEWNYEFLKLPETKYFKKAKKLNKKSIFLELKKINP